MEAVSGVTGLTVGFVWAHCTKGRPCLTRTTPRAASPATPSSTWASTASSPSVTENLQTMNQCAQCPGLILVFLDGPVALARLETRARTLTVDTVCTGPVTACHGYVVQ